MTWLKPLTWLSAKGKQMPCITVIWFLAVNITHDIENVYTDSFLDGALCIFKKLNPIIPPTEQQQSNHYFQTNQIKPDSLMHHPSLRNQIAEIQGEEQLMPKCCINCSGSLTWFSCETSTSILNKKQTEDNSRSALEIMIALLLLLDFLASHIKRS